MPVRWSSARLLEGAQRAVQAHRSAAYTLLADSALITHCLAGDAAAWDALIDRYGDLIFTVALRSGLTEADAQDVFQDVCLLLLNHLGDVRDHARLAAWLISTTKREAWRCAKRRHHTSLSDFPDGEVADSLVDETRSPEADCLALEDQALVRQAMGLLPDRCRTLLTLLYAADPPRSYVDISQELDMPMGSIGPIRARCLRRLERLLKEIGF